MQIRKKMSATVLLVLILAVSIVVLAACNKGNENQNNSSNANLPKGVSIGVGDNIFTEDVTLEQLAYALKNADNLTFELGNRYTETDVNYDTDIMYCFDRTNSTLYIYNSLFLSDTATSTPYVYNDYLFIDNNKYYYVVLRNYREIKQPNGCYKDEFISDGELILYNVNESDKPFGLYEYVENDIEAMLSILVMKDEKLAFADEEAECWYEDKITNCRLELKGSEMTVSYTGTIYDENGNVTEICDHYFIVKGVNATDIAITEEIKAYKDQAEIIG